jgi:hypothetical protein
MTGQVLNHINLGEYIATNVPSLKYFQNEEESRNGESGISALKALCSALRLLQRYNDCVSTPLYFRTCIFHILKTDSFCPRKIYCNFLNPM